MSTTIPILETWTWPWPAATLHVAYLLSGLLIAVHYLPQLRRAWQFPAETRAAQSLATWTVWTICRAVAFTYGVFVLHDLVFLLVVGADLCGRFAIVALIMRAHALAAGCARAEGHLQPPRRDTVGQSDAGARATTGLAEAEPPAAPDTRARALRKTVPPRCGVERVTLSAADGYPLTAMRYGTSGPARANLIVAGATGVPQRFYRRFAQFAASNGFSTMTLDYRGIGLSAPATLRGFEMDYRDWGRLDLAAAVDAMSRSNVPLYMIAHSYGGHAFGLLPNHASVSAFYAFGTGAGWHGWMPPLERIKVLALWHLLGPLLTRWKGYLPWSLVGMGEDLPLGFYRQWKRWCRYPNYFFGDPVMRHLANDFARVRTPMIAANSIDDRWSPPRSRDAFFAAYTNAPARTLDIDPGQWGLPAIGHMGYFRSNATPLWESVLEWFDTYRDPPPAYPTTLPPPLRIQRIQWQRRCGKRSGGDQ